jgi:HlyD family secretion protein
MSFSRFQGLALRGLLILVFVWALLGCQAQSSASSAQSATQAASSSTAVPVKRSLANVVSAEAMIVPDKRADLSFEGGGVLSQVLISEGQLVTAGQELAKLDTRDREQAVTRAEAALKAAQAQLAKIRAGAREEELASAGAALAIAEARAKTAEAAVQIAEGNLAAGEATLLSSQAGVKAATISVDSARGNLAGAQASQRSAQANLTKVLAGATKLELEIAEKQIDLEKNQLWGLQGQRDALGGPGGSSAQRSAAEAEVAAAESRIVITTLQLEELKAKPRAEDVEIARAQVSQAQANVQTTTAQVSQAESNVETAKAQELQSQANVQTVRAQLLQAKAEVESANAQVRQAQAELDLLRAGSRTEDIAVAEAEAAQAEVALTEARNTLDDAVLKAPFDGTVGAALVQAGELVAAGTPVIRLGDLTSLHVQTEDLSEVDVNRVKVGQEATVRVDALGDKTFKAKVVRVAPAAIDRRGDKVYTVTLELEKGQEAGLLWGMTAFVDIKVR